MDHLLPARCGLEWRLGSLDTLLAKRVLQSKSSDGELKLGGVGSWGGLLQWLGAEGQSSHGPRYRSRWRRIGKGGWALVSSPKAPVTSHLDAQNPGSVVDGRVAKALAEELDLRTGGHEEFGPLSPTLEKHRSEFKSWLLLLNLVKFLSILELRSSPLKRGRC